MNRLAVVSLAALRAFRVPVVVTVAVGTVYFGAWARSVDVNVNFAPLPKARAVFEAARRQGVEAVPVEGGVGVRPFNVSNVDSPLQG